MKLSIITVNLNNKEGLEKTLNSVFGQSFTDYEYIVIDGDSTDGSAELINNNSSKFAYFIIEKDNGIYDAMNKGIKRAKGEYCLFLNSGDCLYSKEVLEKFFSNNFSQDVVCGHVEYKNGWNFIPPQIISVFHFYKTSLPHQAAFIKLSLLQKYNGYNVHFKIISDWIFFLNAFINGATYKHLPIMVALYEGDGVSTNLEKREREHKYFWQENYPYLLKDFEYLQELEKAYKIPGVKFIMKYIYPLYKKIKDKF
jgi:glycosyltransferase involved in cell wall biosynthesis